MKQCTCYALRAIDCTCKPAKYGELYTSPTAKQEQGEPVGKMTPRRAEMFMSRFKHEEKMLGPNEQAALDYVIAMLVAKQEQGEPVAYIHRNEYNEYRLEPHDDFDIKSIPFNVDVPLFKSPQQRAWVALTLEERDHLWEVSRAGLPRYNTFAGLVESKLKEKNT